MTDLCTDGRFELIEKYKKELIESTNIETAQDEMEVLDSILFRFWQMGWLDRLEQPERKAGEWIQCSERLPDIGEHHVSEPCIVYCSNGAYGFAELEENIFGQVGWDCERDDEYHEPLGEVLAWMPLPEPYKGETGMNTT